MLPINCGLPIVGVELLVGYLSQLFSEIAMYCAVLVVQQKSSLGTLDLMLVGETYYNVFLKKHSM